MNTLANWGTVFNAVLAIIIVVVGAFVWRRGYSKSVADGQDRVIAIQKSEIDALTQQVTSLREELGSVNSTLATVRYVLHQQGTDIIIEGDYVTLRTTPRAKSTTVRKRIAVVQREVEQRDRVRKPRPTEGGEVPEAPKSLGDA